MAAKQLRNWTAIVTALVLVAVIAPRAAMAQSGSSGFKQSWDKFTHFFKPSSQPEPANDGVSLATQGKPSADLYIATARVYEHRGDLLQAEKQYKQGLRLAPKHLGLQLGYARLKDRQGRLDEAIALYQEVAKCYPTEATVFNDMGLCYARRGRLTDAATAMEKAVALQPQRALFRNNLATVLVDAGRADAALLQLKAIGNEAVACYNLGYLLEKKGELRLAALYFSRALERDPSLTPAKICLERLARSGVAGSNSPGSEPAAPPLRLTMPQANGSTGAAPGSGPPAGWTTAPQMTVQRRAPESPRQLPPVEPQIGEGSPRVASAPSQTGYNASPDRGRPISLPPVEQAPPSAGQTPADVSVPVPGYSVPRWSPSASVMSSNRLAQRPTDLAPTRVQPLPPVENAPLPPSGDQNETRIR